MASNKQIKHFVMKHKERDLENECRKLARLNGWACWKNEKNGNKGIPDSSFLHPDGRFFLIEFKKDGKQKPRPEQIQWLERYFFCAFLISSVESFCKLLKIKELNPKG